MDKKTIIKEEVRNSMCDLILEDNMTQASIVKIVKDAVKNDRDINKDIEKKVKSLVASCVNNLFKTLWQRRNFYEDEIKNG